MKYSLILLLFVSSLLEAKAPKLYHCQQNDGNVVVQDRRCNETKLPTAVPKRPNPIKSQAKTSLPKNVGVRPAHKQPRNALSNHARSPYFMFGWDRFLPANWMLVKQEVGSTHHWLLSKTRFNDANDFDSGIKLSVYAHTMRSQSQGAFALALTLYHQIREQYGDHLIDSQFKTHDRYKIFNIGYRLQGSNTALTEFYIDESNNDLFVLTIQSPQSQWTLHQQLANRIINKL